MPGEKGEGTRGKRECRKVTNGWVTGETILSSQKLKKKGMKQERYRCVKHVKIEHARKHAGTR